MARIDQGKITLEVALDVVDCFRRGGKVSEGLTELPPSSREDSTSPKTESRVWTEPCDVALVIGSCTPCPSTRS